MLRFGLAARTQREESIHTVQQSHQQVQRWRQITSVVAIVTPNRIDLTHARKCLFRKRRMSDIANITLKKRWKTVMSEVHTRDSKNSIAHKKQRENKPMNQSLRAHTKKNSTLVTFHTVLCHVIDGVRPKHQATTAVESQSSVTRARFTIAQV